jgi:hypothetical protein
MKPLFLLLVAVVFATGTIAQSAMKDCVMMKDGKMWVVKNMTTTMTCKNGSTVMANGTVKGKDGKTMMMKNGDCITEGGDMMKMDMSSKPMNCMMMKDGKMMTMMAMDKTMTMKNGAMVMTDGSVKMKDGKTMKMANGDCMDMDGNTMKMGADKSKM